jgi:predicted Zn-dependent protease
VAKFDDVFAALERVGKQEGSGGSLPSWLMTHPAPAERVESAQARIAAAGPQPDARIGQETFLQQIDDLVYGKDPRDGFFRGATFYHPKLRFQMTFPEGWQTENLPQAVIGVARNIPAALQLAMAGRERPESAIRRFFSEAGIAAGRVVRADFNGAPAAIGEFQAQTEGGVVQGLAAFVSRGDVTYQLIGYTPAQLYGTYAATFERAMRSFAPVDDPAILNVQPQRIDVVKVQESMSVGEVGRRFKSPVSAQTLAILNGLGSAEDRLQSGALAKRVVGRDAQAMAN